MQFLRIKRYGKSMSGSASNADVLRFLIRNWEDK
jgi:hypothetical protein